MHRLNMDERTALHLLNIRPRKSMNGEVRVSWGLGGERVFTSAGYDGLVRKGIAVKSDHGGSTTYYLKGRS